MIKSFWLLAIMVSLFSGFSYSQTPDDTIPHLKEIPADGILLNKAWKFYPGDDIAYSKYDYEGKEGIPVNPTLLLDRLPVVKRAGIGWFRLKLQVDSSLRNKTIGITLSMFGAAEMYLNGELIYQFGNVSTNYEQEKTQAIYGSAFNFKLGNDENQLLAVRYSYHPRNLYLKVGVIPNCLRIIMFSANENIDYYALAVKRNYQFIGVALVIDFAAASLTLFFFFSFRYRKEYMYYGLYFGFQFLGMLLQYDFMSVGKSVKLSSNEFVLLEFIAALLLTIASLFYLNGMYALFQLKRTKFYWFLFSYAIISIVLVPFLPPWGGIFSFLFFPLTCVEILPV